VRKIQRPNSATVAALAMAALAMAFATVAAACGAPAPTGPGASAAPVPSSTAAAAAPVAGGVTRPSDVFGPACNELPQAGTPGSAVRVASLPVGTAIAANPLLRTMTTALLKAGLTDALNQQKEVTVFAPYDRGFQNFQQNLGNDRFNALLADQNTLGDTLKYHVIAKRYDRAGLVAAGTVTTLQGGGLRISDAGDTLEITDNAGTTAHVLCGNIPTANATLFVIDQVVQPKRP